MAVITISRELGSGGDETVDLLCDRLGYCRVDKAMLSQIAEGAGIDVKAVLAKERDVTSKPRLISDQMTSLYGRQPNAFGRQGEIDDQTYVRIVRETMHKFAQTGDAIIIGRGGQIILHDVPGVLHVHLYASPDARAHNLTTRYGISRLEAQRRIERSDERKRLYIRNVHSNANWKDLKYYHLTVDVGYVRPQVAAEIIVTAAHSIAAA
ncbi:MAG: cytidylate kinase-like family protein [Anaerolineae bacterium]|nr:cytidylate kinase-like family protein [Anaerolineae bacterium]